MGEASAQRRLLQVTPGRGGGVGLACAGTTVAVTLDPPEAAELTSSLAVLGPSVSDSASSVVRKLAEAVHGR